MAQSLHHGPDCWIFWEMTSRTFSVFALFGSTVDLGQGVLALLCNDRCRSSAVAVLTGVDTPVFAQWLIPMDLTIEISQLQFDKVVFVPVVQIVRCAAMSCGGESFSPAGAHVYAWVNVKPMQGKYTINYIFYTLGVFARSMTGFAALTFLRRQPQLLPVQVEGQASQWCCYTGGRCPCCAAPQVLFVH